MQSVRLVGAGDLKALLGVVVVDALEKRILSLSKGGTATPGTPLALVEPEDARAQRSPCGKGKEEPMMTRILGVIAIVGLLSETPLWGTCSR